MTNTATQAETVTRFAERAETITRLNALTGLDWTVDADYLPCQIATDLCAYGDGCQDCGGNERGTCYFPDADGLCPNGAIRLLTATLVVGSYVSVDVVL
jgi:hypothetical protein